MKHTYAKSMQKMVCSLNGDKRLPSVTHIQNLSQLTKVVRSTVIKSVISEQHEDKCTDSLHEKDKKQHPLTNSLRCGNRYETSI